MLPSLEIYAGAVVEGVFGPVLVVALHAPIDITMQRIARKAVFNFIVITIPFN